MALVSSLPTLPIVTGAGNRYSAGERTSFVVIGGDMWGNITGWQREKLGVTLTGEGEGTQEWRRSRDREGGSRIMGTVVGRRSHHSGGAKKSS